MIEKIDCSNECIRYAREYFGNKGILLDAPCIAKIKEMKKNGKNRDRQLA